MKALFIIATILLSTISLLAQWEKNDKGYITSDTLIGNKRYVLDENALVVENKYSIKKVDLNTGNITNEIVFEDTTHTMAVADDNLEKVYLLYDGVLNSPTRYEYVIVDYITNDTIIMNEVGTHFCCTEVESNLSLINDSLLMVTGNRLEDDLIYKAKKPFSSLMKLSPNNSVKESVASDFYFDRYNLWNSRSNNILVVSSEYSSIGSSSSSGSEVKLKLVSLDSLKIKDLKSHRTSSRGYVPRASFSTYALSSKGLIYYDYYYYTQEYVVELMRYTFNKHHLNQLVDAEGKVLKNFNFNLGDYVQFTTDDKWLVATKMNGENSVDFKVYSLEGELIFTDNIPNVTSEQVICYTDSTYFFESGNKILMYNTFDNNLTNVSEENTNSIMKVYPNPTSKLLNIKLPETNQSSVMTIINQKGNIIESISIGAETLINQDYKLDVSQYPSGIYFIRINTNDKTSTSKFIKI